MRKVITLLLCCWALAFGAQGIEPNILPLKVINDNWKSKPIPVKSSNGTVDVMTLMRAFHAVWPTASVQAIIGAAGDNSY